MSPEPWGVGGPIPLRVLVEVTVEDISRFWETFQERGLPLRRRHGSSRALVMRRQDDGSKVAILFDWESEAAFQAFLDDPEVKASMRASGTQGPPTITFLEPVGELDA